jgi:hypothetical protein
MTQGARAMTMFISPCGTWDKCLCFIFILKGVIWKTGHWSSIVAAVQEQMIVLCHRLSHEQFKSGSQLLRQGSWARWVLGAVCLNLQASSAPWFVPTPHSLCQHATPHIYGGA